MISSRLPRLPRAMISRYGMSDEFDMVAMESVSNQYLGGDSSLWPAPLKHRHFWIKR